jgi:hypothetical protein
MIDFEVLLNIEDTDTKDFISKVKKIRLDLINKKITESEFDELFEDLKQLNFIKDKMQRVEILIKLKQIIKVIDCVRRWSPI